MRHKGYPREWNSIAYRIKAKAGWRCERCGHPDDRESNHVLTTHHLDGNKSNSEDWNLAALCQICHLSIQGRVKMDQLFFESMLPVSDWFKPHLEGYLRSKELKKWESEDMMTPPTGDVIPGES